MLQTDVRKTAKKHGWGGIGGARWDGWGLGKGEGGVGGNCVVDGGGDVAAAAAARDEDTQQSTCEKTA
ncbi:transcription factor mef2A [Gracilaria domingensis]|nr:transcription factor mef2A [Gracilaria domingensis]